MGCLSLEPWCDVAHDALGCSDVYGMLQKVVVGLCCVRFHTLELDHKMSSQRVLCLPLAISCPLPVCLIFVLQCVLCIGTHLFFERDVVSPSF